MQRRCTQTLQLKVKVLGVEHPLTLASMTNPALVRDKVYDMYNVDILSL